MRYSSGVENKTIDAKNPQNVMPQSDVRTEDPTVENVEPVNEQKPEQGNIINNLMDLNDNCLLHILGFLNSDDLTQIAIVCKHLYRLARFYFGLIYKRFSFSSLSGHGTVPMDVVRRIFRIFGDQMISMSLMNTHFDDRRSILQEFAAAERLNCFKNLKELSLNGFEISNDALPDTLFQRIEALELANGWIGWRSKQLANLKRLKLFKMRSAFGDAFNAPFLEELLLESNNTFLIDDFKAFLSAHPGIKKLSIVNSKQLAADVFSAIGELKNLNELEFQQLIQHSSLRGELFQENLNHLSPLSKLKTLKFNCVENSVSNLLEKFVANGINLEHLELANGPLDERKFECIVQLKMLKVLKLNQMKGLDYTNILGFAKNLKMLNEFHIKTDAHITPSTILKMIHEANMLSTLKVDCQNFLLDLPTYLDILTRIQKRDGGIKLNFTIYGNGAQLLVPTNVTNGSNENWLCVKELDRSQHKLFQHNTSIRELIESIHDEEEEAEEEVIDLDFDPDVDDDLDVFNDSDDFDDFDNVDYEDEDDEMEEQAQEI